MTPQVHNRAARYLRLGEAYISAARDVLAAPDFEQVRLPFYSLLCHGMELALKSVAARKGWDDERLMWLGHDLDWAWRVTLSDAGFEAPGARAVGGVIHQLSRPHHASLPLCGAPVLAPPGPTARARRGRGLSDPRP